MNSRYLSLHTCPNNKFIKVPVFIILIFISSCRKEPVSTTIFPANFSGQNVLARSSDTEQEVLDEAQWMISYLLPVISDEAVYNDILSGNRYSSTVTARLNVLGFSDFDDFTTEFISRTSAVSHALNTGLINAEWVQQILQQNINNLNFSALGDTSAYLPCYQEFVTNMMFVAVAVAAASETVIGAVIAGVAGTAAAYLQFKNCLHENYPNGE